ncbi:MAG: hypothetical protein KA807_19045, partial [Prolixibacteraceae bacterium]|nr:hypothetical protein [Prolixibacteraceae bacterium]
MSYSEVQETLTPAVFAHIENENLTNKIGARIVSFEFEEIDDGDDKISLRIVDEYGELIDDEFFQVRNKIRVQWGYIGGRHNLSAERTGILLDPEYSFSQAMTMITLNAFDDGSKLHGRADQKVWTQIKHSDIATEIARKHHLKSSIKETVEIKATEPQGNKSDYEFLTYLASQNNYDFYIDVDTL